uniref:Uncharacterized protein n=1 Tax=Eucampia antarctica TaxID=49252 RepID=A0A7S2SGA6_9STRA|mmetsp:Transcript_7864/g.7451  ORF Transcript_7864/g.7451 Transcript_7864/m.7451 type:complete len:162 (+) Transcript_7864:106-591(+)|eukprot:CAMPEP_0197832268 /NCGR_PEP_ID=MMETSP1437-20131217/13979_1 /TAXON_ID=49252 ORGANISM="Eucampia antarctica, Strain CCMP1452" /NCGR_SAMPLE_ID=MMETSP1437 /ASSEMBLY_ACC=CAM_ASM_001096 /LENGTH=161 /DNA_ID=CAMNT_0043435555 /DNA_START=100 /DNA_END=585 /DNA_ORIENTATION=-
MMSRIPGALYSHARVLRRLTLSVNAPKHMFSSGSGNITYSGGHAAEGQGGFYGSGGARVINPTSTEHRPGMMALVSDVETIQMVMDELHHLETILMETSEESNGEITGQLIEMKSKIKKLCTSSDFLDCLNRLELKGEPIWGLSSQEREMIMEARQKVNDC